MSGFKPFRVGDHVNLPADRDKTPKLINKPPSNGVFSPMREFLDAIVDMYEDGASDSIGIEFHEDGLLIVEKSEDCNSISEEIRNVQECINDIGKRFAIVVKWMEPMHHINHSTLCQWTVRCEFTVE